MVADSASKDNFKKASTAHMQCYRNSLQVYVLDVSVTVSVQLESVIFGVYSRKILRSGGKMLKLVASKKAISTMIALILIVIVAVAAIGGTAIYFLYKPARAQIVGKITIWHGLLDNELLAWKARLIAFNQEYPNITVTLVSKALLHDALKVAIPAKVGPDLYTWGAQDWQGEFINANLIMPIDDLVDSATRALYYPAAISTMSYKGHLYALPLAAECITLFYNKKYVTTPPADTDQLIAMLTNPPGGAQYGLAHVTQTDPYHMYPWVSGFGGYYYNDTTGLAGLNSTGTIAAATWFKTNILPHLSQDLGGNSQRALFYEGKAAMLISGPWSVADVRKANISFGLSLIPKIVPQNNALPMPYQGVKGIWWVNTTRTSAVPTNAEAVGAFLKWWTGPDNQIALGKLLGWVPVTFDAYKDSDIAGDPVIAGFGNQLQYTIGIPSSPQMQKVWGPAGTAWDAVTSGTKTPTQAFQDAEDQIITDIKTAYGHYP